MQLLPETVRTAAAAAGASLEHIERMSPWWILLAIDGNSSLRYLLLRKLICHNSSRGPGMGCCGLPSQQNREEVGENTHTHSHTHVLFYPNLLLPHRSTQTALRSHRGPKPERRAAWPQSTLTRPAASPKGQAVHAGHPTCTLSARRWW